METELERLRRENRELKAKAPSAGISFKVSQKGALSAYGLGRFPVTLYKEQWRRLLEKKEDLLAFIVENEADLKEKT